MTSAVYDRTPNIKLGLLEFSFPNWADDANLNMKLLDASIGLGGVTISGAWENSTAYTAGVLIVDADENSIWRCSIPHTSAAEPTTFAQDRATNPTYWTSANQVLVPRGMWTNTTVYYANDVVYKDANKYSWAMGTKTFTSSVSYDADVAAGNLAIITDTTQTVADANTAKTAAQGSATAAAGSATAASGSATNAANSASASATSATNAANSATAANTSKNAAQTAQTAAELAEQHAELAEANAEAAEAGAEAALAAMMPDAPSDGLVYGRKNAAWSTIIGGAVISDTAPPGPLQAGQLWWESDSGNTYIWYTDANSSQWVQQNVAPPSSVDWSNVTGKPIPQVDVANLVNDLAAKAPLANPSFTGAVFTPTLRVGTVADGSSAGGGIQLLKRGSGFSETIYFLNGAGGFRGSIGVDASDQMVLRVGDVVTDDITFSTSGSITTAGNVVAGGNVYSTGSAFVSFTTSLILATTGAGTVILRPVGAGSATGQATLGSTGNFTTAGYFLGTNGVYASSTAAMGLTDAGSVHYLQFAANVFMSWNVANGDYVLTTVQGIRWTSRNSDGAFIVPTTAFKPGGGAWTDSSDIRIKTVLGDYESGLDQILALQPKRFTYKGNDTTQPPAKLDAPPLIDEDGNVVIEPEPDIAEGLTAPYPNSGHYQAAKDGTEFIGLVAQETETAMPELVKLAEGYIDGEAVTDLRNIDSTPLIYALINAVKTLTARIEVLEAR